MSVKCCLSDGFVIGPLGIKKDNSGGVFIGKEDRIVIPFFNSHGDVVAVQGRAINFKDEENARQTAKYITIKADKSIDRLWYGLWRANTKKRVYVVEGPIDSLFLENAVAMVGYCFISSFDYA